MRSLLLASGLLVAALYACGGSDSSTTLGSGPGGSNTDGGGNGGGGGDTDGGGNGGGGTDSGSGGGMDSGSGGKDSGPADAGFCVKTATPSLGHHNPGLNCITGNCHGPGGSGPLWTVAGTLWADTAGTTPLSGATVVVTDANGQVLQLATATNGNFHTATPVVHPLTVMASKCPNTLQMTAKVSAVQGCNQTNCHNAAMPMHLP